MAASGEISDKPKRARAVLDRIPRSVRKGSTTRERASSEEGQKINGERIPGDISEYLIAEVEERLVKGVSKRILRVYERGEKRIVGEDRVRLLPEVTKLEVGDVLALEYGSDRSLVVIDNLGKKATVNTELLRLAYEIGNGRVFPESVRAVEADIKSLGQKYITDIIADLERKENGIVFPDDPEREVKFRHGYSRYDFRGLQDTTGDQPKPVPVMTIDPDSARDHDDAVHARKVRIGDKEYVEIGVHIADVSRFVALDKQHPWYPLFEEARKRAQTSYFPTGAYPMLPRVLADKLCSLEDGEERISFSTVFMLDKVSGEVVQTYQGESVVSCDNVPYGEAQRILDASVVEGDKDPARKDSLALLHKYGNIWRESRKIRGEIEFPEREELDVLESDDSDAVPTAGVKKRLEMNKIIQDLMLQANEATAVALVKMHEQQPEHFNILLRFHQPPELNKAKDLARIFGAKDVLDAIEQYEKDPPPETPMRLGSDQRPFINQVVLDLLQLGDTWDLPDTAKQNVRDLVQHAVAANEPHHLRGATAEETESNIQKQLELVRDTRRNLIKGQTMRLLLKAKYTTDPLMHFGLSKFPITHATSPIRRFADVIVHHLLKAALAGSTDSLHGLSLTDIKEIADHLNSREKIADEAERLARNIWGAGLFQQLITPENPQPELQNVEIIGIPPPGVPKGDSYVRVRVRHPQGEFPFMFDVPLALFEGLPSKSEARDKLLKTPISVRLTGVDITQGTLALKLISSSVTTVEEVSDQSTRRRDQIQPEMLAIMKQLHLDDIALIEADFPEIIAGNKPIRDFLEKMRTDVNALNENVPGSIVDQMGGRIQSLRIAIERHSKLDLESLRARRRRNAPAVSQPAPVEKIQTIAPDPLVAARLARLDALERELAELRRAEKLRRLEKLEQELAQLRARRNSS